MKEALRVFLAERTLERRFGSLQGAWAAAAAKKLDQLVAEHDDGAGAATLRDSFVTAIRRCSSSYRGPVARVSRGVAALWLDASAILVITLLIIAIRGDARGGGRVIASGAVPALGVLERSTLRLDTVRGGLGGYGSIEEVVDRVALQPIPVGAVVRGRHLSEYRLDAAARARMAEGVLLSVPLTGSFQGAVVPGQWADLMAVRGPSPSGADACERFADLLVVSVDGRGGAVSAVLSVPAREAGRLTAILGRSGSTVRPVVGDADC